jgi:NAD(P)H dehydrogenase (quinone)
MTTAVIGATGRTGREVVRGLLARQEPVLALVRDPAKAAAMFGPAEGLRVLQTPLDDLAVLRAALAGARTLFLALGSAGLEGNLQRVAIQAAAQIPVEQVVRLSVLNTSPTSLGINQRAHWNIDFAAGVAGVGYSTIRPAIFSASLLAAAAEVRASRTWTGLADTGRVPLIDYRDAAEAAVRVLTDPGTWGRHYDLTGPDLLSWPDAMRLLSDELGEPVTFVTTSERELIGRLTAAGIAAGQAELLVTREWAIAAGENERTTGTLAELTGHAPRTVAAFLHEQREAFR